MAAPKTRITKERLLAAIEDINTLQFDPPMPTDTAGFEKARIDFGLPEHVTEESIMKALICDIAEDKTVDGELVAGLAISDPLKPSTWALLSELGVGPKAKKEEKQEPEEEKEEKKMAPIRPPKKETAPAAEAPAEETKAAEVDLSTLTKEELLARYTELQTQLKAKRVGRPKKEKKVRYTWNKAFLEAIKEGLCSKDEIIARAKELFNEHNPDKKRKAEKDTYPNLIFRVAVPILIEAGLAKETEKNVFEFNLK